MSGQTSVKSFMNQPLIGTSTPSQRQLLRFMQSRLLVNMGQYF